MYVSTDYLTSVMETVFPFVQAVGSQCGSMPRPAPTSPPLLSPSSFHRTPWPEEACDGPELEL